MSEVPSEGAVTILFTDVEGSTDLRTRLGDDVAQEILREHEEIVRRHVAGHGGREVKSLGDGFMIAFASPRKAISCAVQIQKILDERNRAHAGREVRVRIGINAGDVLEKDGDLLGAAVNAASRIAAKAYGGQILISSVVKDLAGKRPDLSYVDRGLFWLRGFPERWRLFEVIRGAAVSVEELARPRVGRTKFIGREAEFADLRRVIERATSGHGALVMIGGEPGVGKTRLADETAEEAARSGMLSAVGHCYEMESPPPFGPIVELLETATRAVSRESLREALGDAAPEVARILPELRRLFPDLPPPLDLPPEQERRYLFNCVTEFLARASRVQPQLIVLDDLHWADESTLLLLQHLAERIADLPVLILGTYRDVELDVARPLASALEQLLRRRLAHRVNLGRLPMDGVEAMLRELSRRDPPPSLVRAIYAETEGNPFFVEEVFQHLLEEGKLLDPQGNWRAEVEIGDVDVPEGVRLVIGRRLERLSEEARRALAAAAVVGRSFAFDVLAAVAEEDPDALLDAVEEAQRARLLVPVESGLEARFTFAHELIRQTLLIGLSLPRRQRLHLRIADAMERVHSRDLEARAADLAHHLYQAGAAAEPERAVRYLTLAGDRAMASAAFDEALHAFENASSVLPSGDAPARAGLLSRLALAHRSLGHVEEAVASWRGAIDLYAGLDDADAVGSVCLDASIQLGWAARWMESIEMAQRGLVALAGRESPLRARLLGWAGALIGNAGAHDEGREMVEEASALASRLGDSHLIGDALANRAVFSYAYFDFPAAIEPGRSAAEHFRAAGDLWNLCQILGFVLMALVMSGRLDEAAEIEDEADEISTRLGHLPTQAFCRRARAYRAFMLSGDLEERARRIDEDEELFRHANLSWGVEGAYRLRAQIAFWEGRWDDALAFAEEATKDDAGGVFAHWAAGQLLLIRAHRGEPEEAHRVLAEHESGLAVPDRPAPWGSLAFSVAAAEALSVLGDREGAAALYPVVRELDQRGVLMTGVSHIVPAVAGIAAAAAGRWEDAEEHLSRALKLADTIPLRPYQPEVRRQFAQMLLDRGAEGDRERARTLLDEAIEGYARLGMPRHEELARALLARR